jgi:starch-binding outer membrane protein, SusD/RagB family
MNTRKLIYIGLVAATSVLLACSDDILDKKPLKGTSDIDVFSDADLLENFVNGTYRAFRHSLDDENSLTDGLTDNAYNQHGSADGSIRPYTRAEVSQDNGEGVTRNLWTHAYTNIRRTNLFFEQIVNSPIDPAELTPLEGEMQFIRAFLYFDLLRWYGGVPLITKTYGLNEETYDIGRNTADEVVDFIVSECDEAIAKLPALGSTPSGRANKEAAMALKARALLYAASPLFNATGDPAKWTAARDANKAVMDLTTVSLVATPAEYGDLFSGENTKEIMFARNFTQTNNQGWGVNLWLYSNSYGGWNTTTPTQNLVDEYELTNGKVPSDPTSGYVAQNPYVNRDPRFYESILFNGATFRNSTYDYFLDKVDPSDATKAGKDSPRGPSSHNASRTGYSFRKYTEEDKPADGGGVNTNTNPWIIFRKSEFYLNYAEAEIALGNEDEARTAISAVRARVGMPAVTETGAALVEKYRRERRIELLLEDHRFFDIRRWEIGPEALDVPARAVAVYKNGAVFEYDYSVIADNTRKWHNRLYLLPIPAAEIQRSHDKLTQNPDY